MFSGLVVFFILIKRGPLKVQFIWKGFLDLKTSFFHKYIWTFFYKLIYSFIVFLQDIEFLYYIAYIAFIVFGLTVHPFFFVFHLTDFLRIEHLKNVIKAVWKPKLQLGLTFLVFILVEYYFSILGYLALNNSYDGYCDKFWRCFFTTFAWTFSETGAIGVILIIFLF